MVLNQWALVLVRGQQHPQAASKEPPTSLPAFIDSKPARGRHGVGYVCKTSALQAYSNITRVVRILHQKNWKFCTSFFVNSVLIQHTFTSWFFHKLSVEVPLMLLAGFAGIAGSGGARTSLQLGHFQVTKVMRQVIRCKRRRSKGAMSFRGQKTSSQVTRCTIFL